MSDDIEFTEPPEPRGKYGRGVRLTNWVKSLRAHPNRWAKYPDPVWTNTSYSIINGERAGIEKGEFEAVVRTELDLDPSGKRGFLFVRYVGPLVDEEDA